MERDGVLEVTHSFPTPDNGKASGARGAATAAEGGRPRPLLLPGGSDPHSWEVDRALPRRGPSRPRVAPLRQGEHIEICLCGLRNINCFEVLTTIDTSCMEHYPADIFLKNMFRKSAPEGVIRVTITLKVLLL